MLDPVAPPPIIDVEAQNGQGGICNRYCALCDWGCDWLYSTSICRAYTSCREGWRNLREAHPWRARGIQLGATILALHIVGYLGTLAAMKDRAN